MTPSRHTFTATLRTKKKTSEKKKPLHFSPWTINICVSIPTQGNNDDIANEQKKKIIIMGNKRIKDKIVDKSYLYI